MNELPNDPQMLLSVVNMKLRDDYDSLAELCDDLGIRPDDLIGRMAENGYEYSEQYKKFW